MGKTRLAEEAGRAALGEYPGGVWLVDLAPVADPDPVTQAVADVLGVRERPGQPLLGALVSALADRHLLLVLDNCEHLLDTCARLAEALLQGCARLRILATSREALAIPGEHVWPVPVLSTPPDRPLSLEDLGRYEAARLFLDRARAAQPSLVLPDADAPAIAQICGRLDGLPFALELAAAQLRVLSVAQLAARLDDPFRILTRGSRTVLPRQQTLRATIDWSYDLLDHQERRLFQRLAVFAGGWALEAAEAVCRDAGAGCWVLGDGGGPSLPLLPKTQHPTPSTSSDVFSLLARLVDQSLVVMERSGNGTGDAAESAATDARYRLLETTRAYATERLWASGEEDLLRARHRDWCLALAERAGAGLAGPDQVAVLRELAAEHDNVRAALAWCRRPGEAEVGLRLASALMPYWSIRGHYAEGRAVLQELLRLAPRPDELAGEASAARLATRARALVAAGTLASRQGDYDAARSLLREGLAVLRGLGDHRGIAATLQELGDNPSGDHASAQSLLVEAVAHAQQAGDPTLTQRILLTLAKRVNFDGDPGRSRALTEESLALARRQGDLRGIATALSWLGYLTHLQGNPSGARPLIDESIAIFATLGDRAEMVATLLRRAVIARDQDDLDVARASREQSLALAREIGDANHVGWSLFGLAWIAHDADDLDRARALFEESLAHFRRLAHETGTAWSLDGLGRLTRDQGDDAAARRYLEESVAIQRPLPNRDYLCWTLWSLGLTAYGQGDLGAARAALEESLAHWREVGDQQSIASGLEQFAVRAAVRGRARMALQLAGAGSALRDAIGAPLSPFRKARLARRLEPARRLLDAADAEAAVLAGRAMAVEPVIAAALEPERDHS